MKSCFEVRYGGEIADMNLIREAYRVNDYIEAVEARDKAAGARIVDTIQLMPVAEPALFPRLYRVFDKVQERMGISFPFEFRLVKVRDPQVVVVTNETGRDQLEIKICISPEAIAMYDDEELSFLFGRGLAIDIWGFEKFSNLERRCAAETGDESYPEGESVLPGMGNALYKRWCLKSKLSADRLGAIAAGGFEPSVKAVLREDCCKDLADEESRLLPLKDSDVSIPGIQHFLEFEERRGKATPDNELIFRVHALCLFCQKWFSPYRGDDELKVIDDILDNDFLKAERVIESKEERDHVMAFVAQSIRILTANGRKPSMAELRAIVKKIYDDHTDHPEEFLIGSAEQIVKNGMKAYRRVVKSHNAAISTILLSDLCFVLSVDCRDSEEKRVALDRIANELGPGGVMVAALMASMAEEPGINVVDPLADELVEDVKAKFKGWRTKKKKTIAASSGWHDSLYRYGGDLEGERILRDIYSADTIVSTMMSFVGPESSKNKNADLLKQGVRLTRKTSPRVYRVVGRVCGRLGMDIPFEIFCRQENSITASASCRYGRGKVSGVVVVSTEALERLDDDELAFVIGHEFGHIIHQHGQWAMVEKNVADGEAPTTSLPQMGEIVFREWQQKQEISCDRAGAIAAGNGKSAVSALVKVCYGLTSRNFDAACVDELLGQILEIKDSEEIYDSIIDTHPLAPLRIKALSLFCDAYYSDGFSERKLAEVDSEIARCYQWIRRRPRGKLHKAVLHAFVDGGIEMLLADGALDDREIARICFTLNQCTCEPLDEFVADPVKRRKRLSAAVKVLRQEDDDDTNEGLLGQLVLLSLSDGSMSESEHRYLLKMAKRIGYDIEKAHRLISAKIAEVGFPIDTLIEGYAKRLMFRK